MKEHISAYIKELNALYQTGLTTEHSFRPALQRLLSACTAVARREISARCHTLAIPIAETHSETTNH
jgi:hypothetical protein